MSLGVFARLVGSAAERWYRIQATELAAAIAFNALLSLAPITLLLLATASRLLGREPARERLVEAIGLLAGSGAIPVAHSLVDTVAEARGGLLATALGIAAVVFFSSTMLAQLRSALNRIWGVPPRSVAGAFVERGALLVVVPAGVLAFLFIMWGSVVGAIVTSSIDEVLPRGAHLWNWLGPAVAFALLTAVLAILFRFGPRADVRWGDVWAGAALTALLSTAGNALIGQFVGRNLLVSLYGAAGALVVMLLWVYYGAQIFLFGACFTRADADRRRHR